MRPRQVVLCSLPPLSLDRIPAAPAILQSAIELEGFTAKSIDLSIDFFNNQCNKNVEQYNTLASVFRPTNELHPSGAREAAEAWVKHSILKIKEYAPKIIGLSVFTNFQHSAAYMLALAIRKELPDAKIVLGGFGININSSGLAWIPEIRKIDVIKPFFQLMTEKKLCDQVIFSSDSPIEKFVNFVKNFFCIPINNESKILDKNIYTSPLPNYNDYKFNDYLWNQGIALPITGSLGCVRNCTFCDIRGQFGNFKYRRGKEVAEEMIELKKRYNTTYFEFTDSLVNGSLKAFREWLEIIAEYNDKSNEAEKIKWFGQYICRPQKHTPSDIYSLMKRSGVINLIIGVESGSNEILAAMRKNMTVEDVYDELEQFQKNDIKASFLILSGFYNETYNRFLETLKFIVNCAPYIAAGTITQLGVGPPLFINDKMYLGQEAERLGIIFNPYDQSDWTEISDPTNTYTERARRRIVTQIVMDKLGIPITDQSVSNITQIYHKLKNKSNIQSA